MQIQINTDHNIKGSREYLSENNNFEHLVQNALAHYMKYITRVEIHFTDVNSEKVGFEDKRCLIETRLSGLQPIVASHQANSLALALDGASMKMKHLLKNTFGKLQGTKKRIVS